MSTFSGIGGRGDKGSNKYKSLNINNIYQGKSVPTQKSTGNHNFYVIYVWESPLHNPVIVYIVNSLDISFHLITCI